MQNIILDFNILILNKKQISLYDFVILKTSMKSYFNLFLIKNEEEKNLMSWFSHFLSFFWDIKKYLYFPFFIIVIRNVQKEWFTKIVLKTYMRNSSPMEVSNLIIFYYILWTMYLSCWLTKRVSPWMKISICGLLCVLSFRSFSLSVPCNHLMSEKKRKNIKTTF